MTPLRIVFMGTAELSCASLRALIDCPQFQVTAVATQPDRPKGRDLKLTPSPVKALALGAHLPVLQPERARSEEFIDQLRTLEPDLIAVAAYGQILPKSLLELPHFGCLNVHTSLLPKYRGAAPIQWAILNDDPETGVTIMKMDVGLDTGDILTQAKTPITPEDNAQTLHDRLAQMGAELLVRTIPDYVGGAIQPCPQPAEGVSYAAKIKKEDGQLDWTQPARTLWNRVRGLTPWPGAFTFLPAQPKPLLLKIWQAEVATLSGPAGQILHADKSGIVVACGREALRILLLQREGARRLTAQQFLAGHPLQPGQQL
ncbi:MAG TPA: methionyl-tRNA formyltransferase [Bacillota bacterium]|nr:methionyl-tRNA formyltransferase [Bacillota bacterium]